MTSILLLTIAVAGAWWAVQRQHDVSRLLALALAAYVFLWGVFPLTYASAFADRTGFQLDQPPYLRLAQLHLATLAATMGIFALLPSRRWSRLQSLGDLQLSDAATLRLLVISGVIMMVMEALSLSITGLGFVAAIKFAVNATPEQLGRKALIDSVLAVDMGLAVMGAVGDWRTSPKRRRITYLSWFMLLTHAGIAVSQGARAAVLLPPFVYLARLWMHPDPRGWFHRWRSAIFLVAAALVIGPVLVVVGLARGSTDVKLSVDLVQTAVSHAFGGRAVKDQLALVGDAFYTKFEHFQTGVNLLSREGEAAAGWAPITSAMYSPIPRALFLDKPTPMSRNGDASGVPWRIAASTLGDIKSGAVVPVTPAAISLWEFGALGIGLLILGNCLHLVFANSLLTSRSPFAQSFGISLLALPTMEFLFTMPAYLIRDDLRLIVYSLALNAGIAMWYLWRRLTRLPRKSSEVLHA